MVTYAGPPTHRRDAEPDEGAGAWARSIRDADAFYGRLARACGRPYVAFDEGEIEAVAALAAALGVTPADVPGWPPAAMRAARAAGAATAGRAVAR